MRSPLKIDVITLFPEIPAVFFGSSILKRAADRGQVILRAINPRDFTSDPHRTVDDRPFGGGPGMVMMCDPLFQAVQSVKTENSHTILLTPQGQPFRQARARELAGERHLILICGHYEGVDERVRQVLADEEISIGDYILTNGALAAAVVADAITRCLPDVLGGEGAAENDSFSDGLLEYPQYTRPAEYHGMRVPEVLLSGNHEAIARWRKAQSIERTRKRRPDLLSPPEPPDTEQGGTPEKEPLF